MNIFKKSTFLNNIIITSGGTSIAQLLPILASPVLTRVYSPENFGLFGIYTAIVSVISVIIVLRYEYVILLPKTDNDAVHIIVLSFIIEFIMSAMVFIIVLIFNHDLAKLSGNLQIKFLLYIVPINLIILGSTQVLTYWAIREKLFTLIASAKIAQVFLTVSASLIFGIFGYNKLGLILGWLLGQLLNAGIIGTIFLSKEKINLKNISIIKIKQLAKIYKNFPKINSIHAFLNSLTANLPVMILSSFFSSKAVGYYSLTTRVINGPLSIISTSISQVFNQHITELYNNNYSIHQFSVKLVKRLIVISVIPLLVLIIFSTDLFIIFFGNNWRESGNYTQILSPWFFLGFIVSSISYLPLLKGMQKKALMIEIVSIILRVTALMIGYFQNSIYLALLLFSLIGVFILIYILAWYLKIAKMPVA
jgi:O-antigen/teichoic acid export membrane protein